jgi:prepilin-type N-terminal cleavage/methylation domain-containing protein/prepilin-type processing-associated H-X9-DG protein
LCRRRAFSLAELLVVIGIIAVLLSILLPALSRAREQARVAVCAGNERQIYQAMCLYASVNRGVLPIPAASDDPKFPNFAMQLDGAGLYNYADGALWPYLRGGPDIRQRVFLCPSDGPDRRIAEGGGQVLSRGPTRNFSYNFNGYLRGSQSGPAVLTNRGVLPVWTGIKLSSIAGSDHKLLLLEANDPRDAYNTIVALDNERNPSLLSRRHFGRANQCFADGHVELFDNTALVPAAQARHFCILLPTQAGYVP